MKVYLDTSVISHLLHSDTPSQQAATRLFWASLQYRKFDVCISDVTVTELQHCPQPKKECLFAAFRSVPHSEVQTQDNSNKRDCTTLSRAGCPASEEYCRCPTCGCSMGRV